MAEALKAYLFTGVIVGLVVYVVNSRIRRINGASIQDRLVEISLLTCPLQGHWVMPLVTGLAYGLVAVLVVVVWPYALVVNVKRWRKYKPPMSDDELKAAMRELRQRIENTVPMTAEEMEAEREELRKIVSAEK